ncbi:MAG: guanine deaminase, partial [Comamonadaceae bacterium]|nr:guanine deaminase [Comamonadaceae bacterium]
MTQTPSDDRFALRGDLLDFVGTPAWGDVDSAAPRFRPAHWLLVEGGRIVRAQAGAPDAGWPRVD